MKSESISVMAHSFINNQHKFSMNVFLDFSDINPIWWNKAKWNFFSSYVKNVNYSIIGNYNLNN